MKKIAYLECPTGIAGDMCLGALVSAGVPLDYLLDKLKYLGISQEYHLRAELVQRNGQQATKVYVDLSSEEELQKKSEGSAAGGSAVEGDRHHTHSQHHPHPHEHHHAEHHHHQSPAPTRHLPEIEQLIASAGFPARVEARSLAVFRQLADAEGAVHGIPPTQVHFHEVGATDAIVDIVGTCLGLDWLGIDQLYCSALPTGGGTVRAAHGQLPVPTPAVLKLLESRQVPVYNNGIDRELVTPTGAAIAVTLAADFGKPPAMNLQRVGLGAGSRNLPIPNILRLWIGEVSEVRSQLSGAETIEPGHLTGETISVLETQIDDLSPQAIAYTFDALFAAGALDVFTQPIGMKKSRTGILLTVICHLEDREACEAVIFRETTTLGIRRSTQQRSILQREIQKIETHLGAISIKIASNSEGDITNVQPEYEDIAHLARQHNLSWREVHRLALQAWHTQQEL